MGCLKFKESKLNALADLKKEEFFVSEEGKANTRKLDLDKQTEFEAYHAQMIKAVNDNYGLNLTSLFDTELKTTNEGDNAKLGRETIIRITPIDSAFEAIDNKRKELGIYEDQVSIGEYNIAMEIQADFNQEQELKRLAEIRETNRQSGFVTKSGDIFPSAEEAMLSQEEDFDESFSTVRGGASSKVVMQPTYEDYLEQKKALLKKIEMNIEKLYNEKRLKPQADTTSKISRLNLIKESLEKEINNFAKSTDKVSLMKDYFDRDFDLIKEFLANPTLDNIFLAKEVFKYIETSANTSIDNKGNTLFTPKSNTYYEADVKNLIDNVAGQINDTRDKIDRALDDIFIDLLEKHSANLASLYPEYVTTDPITGDQTVDIEGIKDELLKNLQDISWGESFFFGLGQNVSSKNNILDDLMVLEYEKASIRESAKSQKIIADIDAAIEEAEKELQKLGKKIVAKAGKIVYSGYDYNMFYQKDENGNIKPNLVGKFSRKWNTTLTGLVQKSKKEIFIARENKDWAEVERLLTEKYTDLDNVSEFIDFTLLHDIFTGPIYDKFKNPDTVAAQAYKDSTISKIGEEEYNHIVEQQRNFLDNYMEEMRVLTNFKKAEENVNDETLLSNAAKINLEITDKRLSPLEFLKAHQSKNSNMIEFQIGSQSNEKPSFLKYNTVMPRTVSKLGVDTDFYDKDFDVIDTNPALKNLWKAMKQGSKTIAENLIDSDLKVSANSIFYMQKQLAEELMDKSIFTLVKRGLGKMLNLKGFVKSVFSAKRPNYNTQSNNVVLAGEIKTVANEVNKDFGIVKTEIANILGKQITDKTEITLSNLSPKDQKTFLDSIGVSTAQDFTMELGKDTFKVGELKVFSEKRVMQSQTLNLPVLLKALLEISAEHKARTEAKNEMSVYMAKSQVIKNEKDSAFNKKGQSRKSEIERQEFWNEKVILNRNQKDLGGSLSESLIKSFGKADFNPIFLGQHFYKNFTKEEKIIYNSTVKRLKTLEAEISNNIDPKKSEELFSEKNDLEQRLRLLGKDYMFGALFDKVVNQLTVNVGLGYNFLANFRNRTQGFFALLSRDGEFWSNGNIYPVNHFVGLNKLRFINPNYAKEWNKCELVIKQLGRLQDGTNELQKAESKLQKRARWFSPMYGTQVVEYYNQTSGILAMAMDKMVTDKNGNQEPLFDGGAFNVYEDPDTTGGKLRLKDIFRTPENIAEFEEMDTENMVTWKTDIDNMTKSIAGDYSKTGITRVKGSIFTKPFMVFKTWIPRFISSRYRYEQKNIRTGQTETGYLLSTFLNKKTSVAGGLMLGVTGIMGIAASSPILVGGFLTAGSVAAGLAMYKKAKGQGPIIDPTDVINIKEQALFVLKSLVYTPAEIANVATGRQLVKQPTFSDKANLTPQEMRDVRLMARNMQTTAAFILVKIAIQALFQDNDDEEPKPEDEEAVAAWEQAQKDKKENKKWYNFVENQVTGMYQEISLAMDPYALGSTLGSRNGLQNSMDKIVKICTSLTQASKGADEISKGEREGQSKLGNTLRKEFLPAFIRDIGNDTWRGGLESSMETEWDKDEYMDGMFDSDYKKDKNITEKARKEQRLQLIEDYNKSTDEDIRDLSEEEKKTLAKEEALDLIPNPERENYEDDKYLFNLLTEKQKRKEGIPEVTGEPLPQEQEEDLNQPLY
jgi:hypothetical protein